MRVWVKSRAGHWTNGVTKREQRPNQSSRSWTKRRSLHPLHVGQHRRAERRRSLAVAHLLHKRNLLSRSVATHERGSTVLVVATTVRLRLGKQLFVSTPKRRNDDSQSRETIA